MLVPGLYHSGWAKSGGVTPKKGVRDDWAKICALLPAGQPATGEARPARLRVRPARWNAVSGLGTARLRLLPSRRLRVRQSRCPQGPGQAGAGPSARAREGGEAGGAQAARL